MKLKLALLFTILAAGCLVITGCLPGESTGGSLFSCGGAAPSGWSGPVVDGDILYMATMTGRVIALEDLSDPIADLLWIYPPADETALAFIYGNPAFSEGAIFVGTYDGKVYAFYEENGLPMWLKPYKTGSSIVGSPYVYNGTVYIGTSNGKLHAIDVVTGAARTGFETFQTEGSDGIWATPIVYQGILYVGSFDQKLYALNAETGRQVWNPFVTQGAITATPLIYNDVIYIGSFDRNFYAINLDGTPKWSEPFHADGWFWGKAVAYEGSIIAGCLDGRVYALDAETGECKWRYPAEVQVGPIRGDIALVGNVLVFGSEDGKVYAIDAATGTEKWQRDLESPVRASIFGVDGIAYVHATNQKVYALDVENNRPRWVFSVND